MSSRPEDDAGPAQLRARADDRYSVDVRGGMGVQVGEGNTQIIYTYNRLTWTDGVAPPPLVSVSGVIDSPYRGLDAFEEQDAAFFFGREAATAQLLDRLSRQLHGEGLLVVSGVSGAGKSSLLQAGVLPRIRGSGQAGAPGSARWPCLVFTPTRAPLDELAVRVAMLAGSDAGAVRRGLDADPAGFALTARQAALARLPGSGQDPDGPTAGRQQYQPRLLVVVDQFEQVFTQCADERQRQAFITALHEAASFRAGPDQAPAALVVLGVRADFEARCADYPHLADAVQERYLVTAMTGRQLRMAITEPAKTAGSRVDDDLTGLLLAEAQSRQPGVSGAGMLPLLSHALDQAWRSRIGEALTLADYERTGGIEGAIADSAQRAYDHLNHGQQDMARKVFIQLTAVGSDGVDTAVRAIRAELTEGRNATEIRDLEAVLESFTAERLLTLAAGTVEISHEVLLTAWPLLRDAWLAETRADRTVLTLLLNAAVTWASDNCDSCHLYSGHVLEAAVETVARIDADPARQPPLSHISREFLRASDRAQRRRKRRRQSVIAILAAMVIGFASIAAAAVRASHEADHERDVAVSGQLIAQSEELGDTDPVISKLKSIAAWRINPNSAQAWYAMLNAATLPGIAVLSGGSSPVNWVAFSPDGNTLAASSDNGATQLWNVATGRRIGNPLTAARAVGVAAFSPDGKILATGSGNYNNESGGVVQLWDVATHRQVGTALAFTSPVNTLAFSPDGKILATGGANFTHNQSGGVVQLWDVATHRQVGTALAFTSPVNTLAFSPDGRTLAVGTGDLFGYGGTVQLWDVATHRQLGATLTFTNPVNTLAFSPDGKILATGTAPAATNPSTASIAARPCSYGTWPLTVRSASP